MNINDIISHPMQSAGDFYNKIPATTIALADREPLKMGALVALDKCQQCLRTGRVVSFGEGLFYICVDRLVGMYRRKNPMTENEKEFIARQMCEKFAHWSVADLPCFVTMCVGARLPTYKSGEIEYELIVLDIPSILGKMEAYNKMRPNPQALQGGSPEKATEKELTKDQMTT